MDGQVYAGQQMSFVGTSEFQLGDSESVREQRARLELYISAFLSRRSFRSYGTKEVQHVRVSVFDALSISSSDPSSDPFSSILVPAVVFTTTRRAAATPKGSKLATR
jgi:hypothetical protein